MSAATFLPPSSVVQNLSVEDSLSVQQNISVGDGVTVAGIVSAGSVAASTVTTDGNIRSTAGQVRGATVTSDASVNGVTCDFSGNSEFGTTGADTFRVHGTGDGLQQPFVASPASPGAVYSEAEADAVRDALVACLDAIKRHGLMATS